MDFAGARLSRRYRGGGELLTRACGIKSGKRPGILDATAGLGTDAFLLAYHGSAVELCERDPLVAALLADGIRRGEQAEQAGVSEAVARMSLRQTDAVTLLESRSPQSVDVVYLDPMFPRDGRSAKAKKEMNLLQTLLPESMPSPDLLPAALRAAAGRVVVKRGLKAAALDDRAPAFTLKGRSVRFDVYLGGSAPQ